MGTPFIPSGILANSNCSRILAKTINANAHPIEFEMATNTAFTKLLLSNPKANIATPYSAQFVVITGRKTPKAWYKGGLTFFRIISTIWTNAAMTKIKVMVLK